MIDLDREEASSQSSASPGGGRRTGRALANQNVRGEAPLPVLILLPSF